MTHLTKVNLDKSCNILQYKNIKKSRFVGIFFLISILIILFFISLSIGSYELSLGKIINIFFYGGSQTDLMVLFDLRLPRTISALMSGFALSLSGVLVQTLLQNPLASPSTLGISQGAAFGAAFSIVVLNSSNLVSSGLKTNTSLFSLYEITICAFIGAIIVSIIILLLSTLRKMSSQAIILSGIALSSLFMSATILIQYFASEIQLATIVFWTFGDLSRSTNQEVLFLSIVSLVIFIYYIFIRWKLKALSAGDLVAKNLGVNSYKMKIIGMLLASLVAAIVTALNGVIAFMGLIAPHIAKRIIKNDYRFLVPYSVLIGAIILLGADILSRIIFSSTSIPIGIITSFMGAPLFLFLLIKGDYLYDKD